MKRIALIIIVALFATACSATATHRLAGAEHGNVEAIAPAPATSPHCGIERWAVKTGTDPAASQVNLNDVQQATIQELSGLSVPPGFSQDAGRLAGAEFTVYKVSATLVEFKQEADDDFHLVLRDALGNTMVVEIPAPECVHSSSPFLPGITNARQEFEAKYAPGDYWQQAGVPVVVTGVGFFDPAHGQTGAAILAGGQVTIELHPVLDIQFGKP